MCSTFYEKRFNIFFQLFSSFLAEAARHVEAAAGGAPGRRRTSAQRAVVGQAG
jgi:hypothetical protein